MTKNECRYFDDCSAPMCPIDEGLENYTWFSDEDICILKDVPDWVKRQKKIAKKAVGWKAGYFTLTMLQRDCVIGKAIKGIDPDGTEKERENAEKEWLKRHPAIKPVSEEIRAERAARMRKLKAVSY